jgi:hypothetical protein
MVLFFTQIVKGYTMVESMKGKQKEKERKTEKK